MTTIEPLVLTGFGGFALGAVTGYAIKKILKIAAVIIGLFMAGMAYLAYKNIISVNNDQLTALANHTIQQVNSTAVEIMNQTAQHTVPMGAPVVGIIGFLPGLAIGFKKG